MPLASDIPLALANRFHVSIDLPKYMNLGSWAKVDGLDVTFDVVEYRSGDGWNRTWYAPGFTRYSKVKLSRAASTDSSKVRDWLNETALDHTPGGMLVKLFDSAGKPVTEWELKSAMPTKWSITTLDAASSKLAIEQLEVIHLGFLADDRTL